MDRAAAGTGASAGRINGLSGPLLWVYRIGQVSPVRRCGQVDDQGVETESSRGWRRDEKKREHQAGDSAWCRWCFGVVGTCRGVTRMQVETVEAGRQPAVAARKRNAKPQGSAKKPAVTTARVQLHLGEQTSKRLAVHAALEGRNASRVADDILVKWLARYGKGREIFPALDLDGEKSPTDDDGE
jgi:hypothetical protein